MVDSIYESSVGKSSLDKSATMEPTSANLDPATTKDLGSLVDEADRGNRDCNMLTKDLLISLTKIRDEER
eukprot:10793822-Ditylum_brightwellii.AAC.1